MSVHIDMCIYVYLCLCVCVYMNSPFYASVMHYFNKHVFYHKFWNSKQCKIYFWKTVYVHSYKKYIIYDQNLLHTYVL